MFADVKNYIPQSNTCKICIICIPLPKDFDCSGCPSLIPVRMNYQLFMEHSSEKNTQTSYCLVLFPFYSSVTCQSSDLVDSLSCQ